MRLCRRLLGESWEADDAAQEASLQALLGIDRLLEPASFGPWLHAIAANLARKVMRRRRALPVETVSLGEGHRIVWSVTTPTPVEALEACEFHDQINDALSELSPQYREAVIEYLVGGYTYAEVAQLLGVAVSTVRAGCSKDESSCVLACRSPIHSSRWRKRPWPSRN